jgi:diguanylate cyclase
MERDQLDAELRRQASTDPLTGLCNRLMFRYSVTQRLAAGTGRLMFLDLDRFKSINDEHGHLVGDDVLVAVANRLVGAAASDSVVARLGGDEFAVLLPDHDTAESRVRTCLDEPIVVNGLAFQVGASIGVANLSGHTNIEALLRTADEAMFAEKRSTKAHQDEETMRVPLAT